jgi:hypothetical protein
VTSLRASGREVRAAGGFLRGLGRFLRQRVSPAEALRRLERRLEAREHAFALGLRRAVFEYRRSPYRGLFDWAGISAGDVAELLAADGLEETLGRLHQAGVHVGLEEFKGLRPICRPGLELEAHAEDFDNPLSAGQYEGRTGGSGGAPRRVLVGLDLLEHESAYHALFYAARKLESRPAALWLPAPPGAVGIKNALIRAKLGQPTIRWFSQTSLRDAPAKHNAFAWATISAARLGGARIPLPEYTPTPEAARVASFLAECRGTRAPAVLLTTPSSAVRVCAAAAAQRLDISGSFFVLVGEPYTTAKAQAIRDAGCSAASHYAMVEAGMIGLACGQPGATDDVHLVSDKVATIQRDRAVGGNGISVPALFHSTLLSSAPKVMLNVESGDYGVLEQRDCGCGTLPSAFRRHLHSIRSYEKLTSEGMHFLGGDLLSLLEQVLPARFGGHPSHYQLVEREVNGLPKVSLVVSPSVGAVDPAEAVRTTLEFLRQRGIGQQLMAAVWAAGETLNVVRAEPFATAAGKIQPLRKVVD